LEDFCPGDWLSGDGDKNIGNHIMSCWAYLLVNSALNVGSACGVQQPCHGA
jgi:hypothetical protein